MLRALPDFIAVSLAVPSLHFKLLAHGALRCFSSVLPTLSPSGH